MSSFKRKGSTTTPTPFSYPGTRPSPSSSSTIIISTGIPSLDDILGGGLPLSCSMLVLAPDLHSSYGSLVQKYFVAEGLACGHRVVIVDTDPEDFVRDVMWHPKGYMTPESRGGCSRDNNVLDSDGEETRTQDQKIKIAWRYEQMKQFQTSVKSALLSDGYCHAFDLSSRIPDSVVQTALQKGKLRFLKVTCSPEQLQLSITEVLRSISTDLTSQEDGNAPIRLCIPSLGSPFWGNLSVQNLAYFLYSLRSSLRKHSMACASIGMPPHICKETWGDAGWRQKLGWLSDASVFLEAFSGDPSLTDSFPSHHGMVHIDMLPVPHMLVPLSDRFSVLRGLSASSSASGGGGENNLAFKRTRKRLLFETLHLDVEGGLSERRTTPTGVMQSVVGAESAAISERGTLGPSHHKIAQVAKVDVCLEVHDHVHHVHHAPPPDTDLDMESKAKKKKKSVAFLSDRPDLYDF